MKEFFTGKFVRVLAGVVVGGVLIQADIDPDTAMQVGQFLSGQAIELMSF